MLLLLLSHRPIDGRSVYNLLNKVLSKMNWFIVWINGVSIPTDVSFLNHSSTENEPEEKNIAANKKEYTNYEMASEKFAPKARYIHISMYSRFDDFMFSSFFSAYQCSSSPIWRFYIFHSLDEYLLVSGWCVQSYELRRVCMYVGLSPCGCMCMWLWIFWHADDDESTPHKIRACK